MYSLIALFSLLTIGLAVYVWVLLKRLQQQRKNAQAAQEAYAASAQQQRDYLIDSIRILSRGILEGQCPLAEGCIRIKVMIDNLSPQLHHQAELQVIETMYRKTEHIPTLAAWKRLPAAQRKVFQQEIDDLENEYREAIQAAARCLQDYPFEQRLH
ncbi:MAG: DUF2489 domain-containing protein [Nitrincola lacisaponensis]|nr:DUF2489 domain-containing protein [Nitrincola lacisaponensis]